ncbi:MAG: VOC family protein [Bacteroidota bacterium]|nr:VOC family protein [Bacteroidota bacterium]
MKLEHIALTISDSDEIENFYRDILEMELEKSFVLNKDLANKIFNINNDISVFLMKKDNLLLELFVAKTDDKKSFNHVCISVNNRKMLFEKAQKKSYKCIKIERDKSDLIFVNDKSGNAFEIK